MYKLIIMPIIVSAVVSFSTTCIADTCTDGTIPEGRYYADSVSKVLTDNDTWTEFKVIKNDVESGWISFNSSTKSGKTSLSMLITAGATNKKISFYVVANQCNGVKLSVDRFMIEF